MSTLIVTAHPDPASLTHAAARRLAERLGPDGTVVAHLAQEGFDPRFTQADRDAYLGRRPSGADVRAEQARIDGAEHLALVFPVHWWSLPAQLKGWIDRVFIAGWAFDEDDDGTVVPKLDRLTAHLLPIAGTSAASFDRHGYTRSFATQVERGVIDFCGVRHGATAFLHESESGDPEATRGGVETATAALAAAITTAR